ncbi:MAG: DNA cytosine methyltransferase [Candidatus Electrothrix sp. EH2]|nr:DNA cytosine methyltransferase [Candidatus Electrothrix sp. EH2]
MKQPNYISLFSGAGGLDIGLERAGFKAVSFCEIESVFCETLRENQQFRHEDGIDYFAGATIHNVDICEVAGSALTSGEEIDLVVGGPPCQSFSSAGRQLSVLDNRGGLVHEFLRIINELRPKMFLFENVRGLITARDASGEPGGVICDLIEQFHEIGYSCRASLLNAADYGAYQRRVRCFLLASRQGRTPLFPKPTHQKNENLFSQKWRSLGEFLSKFADRNQANYTFPTEELGRQLVNIPDGSGLKSKGKAEPTRPNGHWGYRQGTFIADQTLPARTVTGSASQDWIRHNGVLRRLTLQEVMLLQGFPEDWRIIGTKTQKYKQVGNAVPAVFGELLGAVMRKHLADYPTEPPERIELPKSFRGYIEYTKKDHARNAGSRSVHRRFKGKV